MDSYEIFHRWMCLIFTCQPPGGRVKMSNVMCTSSGYLIIVVMFVSLVSTLISQNNYATFINRNYVMGNCTLTGYSEMSAPAPTAESRNGLCIHRFGVNLGSTQQIASSIIEVTSGGCTVESRRHTHWPDFSEPSLLINEQNTFLNHHPVINLLFTSSGSSNAISSEADQAQRINPTQESFAILTHSPNPSENHTTTTPRYSVVKEPVKTSGSWPSEQERKEEDQSSWFPFPLTSNPAGPPSFLILATSQALPSKSCMYNPKTLSEDQNSKTASFAFSPLFSPRTSQTSSSHPAHLTSSSLSSQQRQTLISPGAPILSVPRPLIGIDWLFVAFMSFIPLVLIVSVVAWIPYLLWRACTRSRHLPTGRVGEVPGEAEPVANEERNDDDVFNELLAFGGRGEQRDGGQAPENREHAEEGERRNRTTPGYQPLEIEREGHRPTDVELARMLRH
ncbi:hypothetical protein BLNAU_1365 [Blattamonas nauphoetae]|uniref:Uncharacterized protein n=1 Tax=Blattamonas nauphoetae TaxID=2049346 RepID=A0ABQ9YJ58_9EUKA|nr:hypothetical protein BLNAU_1365 [Blattamonas nauphoetae]